MCIRDRCYHAAGQFGGLLNVIGSTAGHAAEHQFFRAASAGKRSDFSQRLFFGQQHRIRIRRLHGICLLYTSVVFAACCQPEKHITPEHGVKAMGIGHSMDPVSYTHLDVYKRQPIFCAK